MEHPLPPSSPTPPALLTPNTAKRRVRWWGSVVAVLVLAAVAALVWYLTHRAPVPAAGSRGAATGAGARGGPPSTVGVAPVRHADIPVIIEALGTVISAASVTVTPQVSGVITQVLYKEGQMVQKGQVLATLDPQPFQMALAQAAGARARDAAQLEAAHVLLERYQTLVKQESIARQTVDTQNALVQQLAGTVALDRANEDSARLNLQWSRIVAPVTGRVGLRPIDAGNYVAAGNASGIATITQVSPIDIQFSIPQDRVPEVRERITAAAQLPVTAWDSARMRQLEAGTFLTMDNQIDVQTGTIKAKARFANTSGTLFPNQFVNVRLLLRTIEGAVVVPVIALRHGPNGDFVYVVNADQTVTLRNVTAGISGVNDIAITSGLTLNEQVVTEGGDRLKDGARVRTASEAPAGAAPDANAGRHRRGAGGADGVPRGAAGAGGADRPRNGRPAPGAATETQ